MIDIISTTSADAATSNDCRVRVTGPVFIMWNDDVCLIGDVVVSIVAVRWLAGVRETLAKNDAAMTPQCSASFVASARDVIADHHVVSFGRGLGLL